MSKPLPTRALLDYREPSAPVAVTGGHNIWPPTAGYYRHKLRSGGHAVGVCIWYGPPHDPITGDEMDRGHRWQATINDEPADIEVVWPSCGREPINQAEHDHLAAVHAWAKAHAPGTPQADPQQRINLHTAPILI